MAPQISIVIPTYNRSRLLLRALEAFRGESLSADGFEVIVSDDGSSDGTEALVKSFAADYRIKYHYQEDAGYRAAAARNAGAEQADGEVLVFFDAGEIPGPDFAASHLAAHASVPQVHRAVIGPAYGYTTDLGEANLPADRTRDLSAEQIFNLIPRETDPRYETFASIDFDLRRLPLPPVLFWTGNCSVRTEDFWNAGAFDESFQEWGLEDADLAYRLWDRGVTFALCPEGWAIELPQPRDVKANLRSLARNIERYLQNPHSITPAREMLAILLDVSYDVFYEIQDHYRALLEWEARAKDIDVLSEVRSFCHAAPPDSRVAILGVGGSVPESRPNAVLFDFDRQFCRNRQMPGREVHHRMGLRTGLADNSIDSMLITSRLRGIWECLGDPIMVEAKRVASNVRLAWS